MVGPGLFRVLKFISAGLLSDLSLCQSPRLLPLPVESLESSLQKTGNAPLPNAFDQYVERQFQLYNGEIIQ